ncbi:thioredoxin domain-containing protein [Candidatus Methylacidiphilum infernorum]|uniref:Thioredoxin domain-containing protein n=1 Tax=Candidatus Methylacidiphilum infernorum TaxID=511746 RepID=A0ABX7PU48_9BACT|nr:thioredoxin domain-containing protein [Candidatus Methylacidiphilum infernorum]QSR86477.1 thioredoxin domain-containing protein [Candidatus Methylacidiphilum infernorum]
MTKLATSPVVLLILLASFFFSPFPAKARQNAEPIPPSPLPPLSPEARAKILKPLSIDWIQGDPTAPVIIIEYLDLECPVCAAYYPLLQELKKKYGDKIAWIIRHNPSMAHPEAFPASMAAEAAGRQGKFWEMVGLLLTNQKEWSFRPTCSEWFIHYAQKLGLNEEQFKKDLQGVEGIPLRKRILADCLSAIRVGVDGNPCFFINGEKITNPSNLQEFVTLIEAELIKKKSNISQLYP